MGRPPKPFTVIQNEKKSHRTKAELAARKEAEESLLTGTKMKERPEVKKNDIAHKEYIRVSKLFKSIQKNDDLFGSCINRYCQMVAECRDFEEKREVFYRRAQELEDKQDELMDEGMSLTEYFRLLSSLQSQVIGLDKQIQAKRKLMFEYEKENVMTVASGLRNIPKKEKEDANPLGKILSGG